MSPLVSCQKISQSVGPKLLFENLSLSLFPQERVGLIGPNGAGKSTLLKLIAGIINPTTGSISRSRALKLAYVAQDPTFPAELSVAQVVSDSLSSQHLADHEREVRVSTALSKLGFETEEQQVSTLSGGWLKRLAFAVAIAAEPDILLLDEPTNHLDLPSILWLEGFLKRQNFAYLLVSHDRIFLDRVVTRVVEINPRFPEGVFSVDGDYSHFMEKRDRYVEGLLETQKSLASKARRELEWLRSNAKARTTKSTARTKEAHQILDTLAGMKKRSTQRTVDIEFAASERQTRKLVRVHKISKRFGNRVLFDGLSFDLSPGTVLGLLGPNGSGKSSLLKIISGEAQPDTGTIKLADNLKVVYFDQKREHLDPNSSIKDVLSPNGETVMVRGQPMHVAGWAQKFLFSRDRLEQPVKSLSGGEQARLLISRLMLVEADLLILDEPTNDLDIDTLESLQESIGEFPGAVVLVSHDRSLMDAVTTEILALDGNGTAAFFADTSQWERAFAGASKSEAKRDAPAARKEPVKKKGLSYHEKKELEGMEQKILEVEERIVALTAKVEDPTIGSDADKLHAACNELEIARQQCDALYKRWQELDDTTTA